MRRILFLLALAACSRTPSEPAPAATTTAASPPTADSAPTHPSTPAASTTTGGTAALSLRWDPPARWQARRPSTAMRTAEYLVPRAPGDSDDAECFVITFGAGQGGGVEENIQRWVDQLQPATGAPERSTRTVHGWKVTRVAVAGTYKPMQMPGGPPGSGPRTGWRLVGVIVETPAGSWFFKMTGPDATVKAAAPELDAMIDSVRPA